MDRDGFRSLLAMLTTRIAHQPLDAALGERLNQELPPGSDGYEAILAACRAGIDAGWICDREAGGIRYGRVINAGPQTHGFSVDVVDMRECIGPHHVHPNGEIVYAPGSDHFPTVRDGRALVLYLLPAGAIQFTGKRASEVR
jgi:hypothetical protein